MSQSNSIGTFLSLVTVHFFYGATAPVVQTQTFRSDPFGDVSNNKAVGSAPVICLTPGCTLLAAELLNSMDTTTDPCEDFYQYACGKYIATRTMPGDQFEIGLFQDLNDRMDVKLKHEFEKAAADKHKRDKQESSTVKKTRNFYQACMNTTQINRRGVQPALDLLNATNLSWPVINNNADNATFDLEQAIANIARLKKSALVSVSVGVDSQNASKYILTIDQPELGMPSRDYLLRNSTSDHEIRMLYYRYMTAAAGTFKNNVSPVAPLNEQLLKLLLADEQDRLDSDLLDVLQFEKKLANITTPKESRREPNRMYNPMTVRQLSNMVPKFDWLRLLNAYLERSGNTVDENEIVVVAETQYFAQLMRLIEQTPERVVANYVGWRTVEPFIAYLGDNEQTSALKAARSKYSKAISGQANEPERWKSCLAMARTTVIMGVARIYVEKFFEPESKHLADSLIVSIQEAFEDELSRLQWIGDRERELSIEKMRSMLRLIAYDDRLLNDTWMDEQYSLYVGNEHEHFENMVGNARADDAMMQMRLRTLVDRRQWDEQTVSVNANYNPSTNRIMFLAGILQPPFFSHDQPMAANFGAVGICMGHEITHGFDDQGRHFDKDGSIRDWWGQQTIGNFNRETQCVVDLYSNYTVPETDGLHINGKMTLGENLADLGGTRLSYQAYTNWKAKNAKQADVRLPGLLNFTSDQLFFLSGGLFWCDYKRPESQKQRVLTDEHSPQQFRVLGEFSNFPEFSRAFNCPLGSNMNPIEKCRVW